MTEQAGVIENVTVVGFDLGHGDTAIASTRLATTDEPRLLSVNGLRTIPSIVGRHQDNRIVFGEIAGRNATELVEAYERFKSPDFEARWQRRQSHPDVCQRNLQDVAGRQADR